MSDLIKSTQSLAAARSSLNLQKPSSEERERHTAATSTALEALIKQQQNEVNDYSAKPELKLVSYKIPGTDEEIQMQVTTEAVDPLQHIKKGLQRKLPGKTGKLSKFLKEEGVPLVNNKPDAVVSASTKPVIHRKQEKLSREEKEAWRIPGVVSNWRNNKGYHIDLETRSKANPKLDANTNSAGEILVSSKHLSLADALNAAEKDINLKPVDNEQQKLRTKLLQQKKSKYEKNVTPRISKPKRKSDLSLRTTVEFEPEVRE